MLEPIREYAQRKLSVVGANEATRLQAAHRDHYLALAETVITNINTANKRANLDRLDAELDNLRAAERHSRGDPDPEPGLRLVVAMADSAGIAATWPRVCRRSRLTLIYQTPPPDADPWRGVPLRFNGYVDRGIV